MRKLFKFHTGIVTDGEYKGYWFQSCNISDQDKLLVTLYPTKEWPFPTSQQWINNQYLKAAK